jgi:hypothetical protein
MLIFIFQVMIVASLSFFNRGPLTAKYHNYLTESGKEILEESVGILEMIDGSRFMNDPKGRLTITISYGDLPDRTLGLAIIGYRTCRIIISNSMRPETSIAFGEGDLQSVIMHEIGHCFGLDHFKEEDHVMYWAYQGIPHNFEKYIRLVNDIKRMRLLL